MTTGLYGFAKAKPHEVGTARAALGAFVLSGGDPASWATFRAVPVEVFPPPLHLVAQTVHDIAERDGTRAAADVVALTGALAGSVPAADVAALTDAVPTSANLQHYCDSLRRFGDVRRIFKRVRGVLSDLKDPQADPGAIAGALREIADIGDTGGTVDAGALEDVRGWFETEPAEPDCTLPGLLVRGSVGILAGAGGIGKSTWVLQAALRAAIGRSAWPEYMKPPRGPLSVLALFGEDPASEVHRRFRRIVDAAGLAQSDRERVAANLHIICGTARPLLGKAFGTVTPGDGFAWLRDLVRRVRPDLVILDPLSRFSGASDENDNSAGAALIGLLTSRVATPFETSILMLHHVSKESGNPRGASALLDGSRFGAVLAPLGESDCTRFDIDPEAAHRYPCLKVIKNSYGPIPAPMYFERGPEGLLSVADLRGDRLLAAAEIIATMIGDGMTSREIEREPAGDAIRTALKQRIPKFTRGDVSSVLEAGRSAGVLASRVEARGPSGTPTVVWRAAGDGLPW